MLEIGAGAGQLRGWLPPAAARAHRSQRAVGRRDPRFARARRGCRRRARRRGGAAVRGAVVRRRPGAVRVRCGRRHAGGGRRDRARAAAGRALRAPPGHGDAARAAVREAGRHPGWCRSRTCSGIRAITSGRWTSSCSNASGWRACCASRGDAGHPFADAFAPIFAPFLSPAAPLRRRRGRGRVQGDRRQRRTPADAGVAARVRQPPRRPPQGHRAVEPLPFHSGRYLQSLLGASFAAAGFAVELSEIVARAIRRPAADDETALRYRSLCVGHERLESELPRRLLAAVREPPSDGDILVEAGVFAFVARRSG